MHNSTFARQVGSRPNLASNVEFRRHAAPEIFLMSHDNKNGHRCMQSSGAVQARERHEYDLSTAYQYSFPIVGTLCNVQIIKKKINDS